MNMAKTETQHSNRRKGVTLVEIGLAVVAGIVILAVGIFGWTEIQYRLAKQDVVRDVTEINSAADSWKSFRPGYTGVSMTVLCAAGQQSISQTTCGGVGGTGANTNPFGGSYTIAVAANVMQKTIVVTGLPTERVNDIGDTLAPLTADACQSVTGCGTIDVTGGTVTLTM
ncbi:hypothetical protein [Vibrio sp. THAF190c]|jgi:hypothetical protein|uniref:hypothetical protein n=1 Tax=Vibrio sp. THAF190c TaxID=2587865 RepID=UPI001269567E|nr:hypothetical protein [Vibrio sp. THAF190c]QFT13398.1 hypothetical protein FIV04_25945 [Vibrio sp. THAF190c]